MESLGEFEATAYGPPWDAMNGTGITSQGVDLLNNPERHYLIAVDPGQIPYGTLVRIQPNPYGTSRPFVAADTGGAIVGKRIDFYVAEGREAQAEWGRRTVEAWAVGKVDTDVASLTKAATGRVSGASSAGGDLGGASSATTAAEGEGLFSTDQRSGALKALVWVSFVLGGLGLLLSGIARMLGLRGATDALALAVPAARAAKGAKAVSAGG